MLVCEDEASKPPALAYLTKRCISFDRAHSCSDSAFEKVAREWHDVNAPQWAKVHAADVLRSFERDVFPAIDSVPIAALTPPKLLEVLCAVVARSAIETAKRLPQRISGVDAYAIASGIADSDPAEKVGAALKPMPKKGRQPACQ